MAVIPGTENPETLTGGIENDIITGLGALRVTTHA